MADLSVLVRRSHGRSPIGKRVYTTTFPATENPIREGGLWVNGLAEGVDWLDVRTTPGFAFGTGTSPSPPYNDSTAILTGSWGSVQSAEATVVVPASPTGNEEVELRLLTTIAAHAILGYEILFSVTTNPYVQIVRWLGGTTLPDFVYVTQSDHGPQLSTGHRIRATVTASGLISAYVDTGSGWTLVSSGTDTVYTSGAPGMGYYAANGGDPTTFGLSAFSATAS